MQTMHPTLLIGPADWQPARMPQQAFDARLAALWAAAPQAAGAIVFGDAYDHAGLAWLTSFTPKLEPGVALLRPDGEASLLVGGGINMIPAAKPLTWIADTLPLRGLGRTVAAWAAGRDRVLLIGGGRMPFAMRRELTTALGTVSLDEADGLLRALMRRKSPHERAALRGACVLLGDAVAALVDAARRGAGVTDAVLRAEQVAHHGGAQDVRSLFGVDGRLRPFEGPVAGVANQVYLAVRDAGYWAEGFVVLDAAAAREAGIALDAAIARVAPGVRKRDAPAVSSMGLGLGEPAAAGETFVAGEVVSVRAGPAGATVSAMVAVTDTGREILWRAP